MTLCEWLGAGFPLLLNKCPHLLFTCSLQHLHLLALQFVHVIIILTLPANTSSINCSFLSLQTVNITSLYENRSAIISSDGFEEACIFLLGIAFNTTIVCPVQLTNATALTFKQTLIENFRGDGGGIDVLHVQEALEALVLKGRYFYD